MYIWRPFGAYCAYGDWYGYVVWAKAGDAKAAARATPARNVFMDVDSFILPVARTGENVALPPLPQCKNFLIAWGLETRDCRLTKNKFVVASSCGIATRASLSHA